MQRQPVKIAGLAGSIRLRNHDKPLLSFDRATLLALSLANGKGAKSFIANGRLTLSGYRDLQVHA
jgi:hypothetical protein